MTLPIVPEVPAVVEPVTPVVPEAPKELTPAELKSALAAARQEAASYRTKYQAAKPFEDKAKELEDAQKSDVEKLTAAQAASDKRASAAETELMQIKAARAAGLDLDMADRLRGSTKEEFEADAKKLAEKFPAAPVVARDVTRRPRASLADATPVSPDAGNDDSPEALAKRVKAKRRF
jgi:hypothetical protein